MSNVKISFWWGLLIHLGVIPVISWLATKLSREGSESQCCQCSMSFHTMSPMSNANISFWWGPLLHLGVVPVKSWLATKLSREGCFSIWSTMSPMLNVFSLFFTKFASEPGCLLWIPLSLNSICAKLRIFVAPHLTCLPLVSYLGACLIE